MRRGCLASGCAASAHARLSDRRGRGKGRQSLQGGDAQNRAAGARLYDLVGTRVLESTRLSGVPRVSRSVHPVTRQMILQRRSPLILKFDCSFSVDGVTSDGGAGSSLPTAQWTAGVYSRHVGHALCSGVRSYLRDKAHPPEEVREMSPRFGQARPLPWWSAISREVKAAQGQCLFHGRPVRKT